MSGNTRMLHRASDELTPHSSMIHIVLWKWASKSYRAVYTHEHVNIMAGMLRRHLHGIAHRILLVSDNYAQVDMTVDAYPLWDDLSHLTNRSGSTFPSCYRRLKLFDPETQASLNILPGDRVCSIDLDGVVVGDMRHLLQRKERFVGWAVRGEKHPRVFNGSMFLFTAGDFQEIWHEFRPETSPEMANKAGYFGSDQSWLSYMLAKHPDCHGWEWPRVLSYPREMRGRLQLPRGSSIVFFNGRLKPWMPEVRAPWVKQHWKV